MRLMKINEVGARIALDPQTIRNKLAQEKKEGLPAGCLVPRSIVMPGGRSRRWEEDDVDAWCAGLFGGAAKGKKVGKGKGQRVRERLAGLREAGGSA